MSYLHRLPQDNVWSRERVVPRNWKSRRQMPAGDVLETKRIAKHRVHVERAIAKIKKFKIVSDKIPNTRLGITNHIWYVVSMLSNFQPHIFKGTVVASIITSHYLRLNLSFLLTTVKLSVDMSYGRCYSNKDFWILYDEDSFSLFLIT
ncbi:hypothetical protein XENOCAPTIV_028926 [Xenoophorus captivus]|uniref:DDE Tnp4 domain-containing protein n=1 Tax=Xenoophorus captivus TaxID=1517983 RepID=A0ABV0RJ26_9TELE